MVSWKVYRGSHDRVVDGPLGGVGPYMGVRGGDVEPLEHPFDSGEVLRILLGPGQESGIVRIPEEIVDLAAQSEGGHMFLGGEHVFIDDSGPGLHGVGHLIGDVAFDYGSGVGGYCQPEQRHARQSDHGRSDPDPRRQFLFSKNRIGRSPIGKGPGSRLPCRLRHGARSARRACPHPQGVV